ncbi:3-dehydroquinate synthase [candidate division LCP-89 bacterium B3_LCP]|uniref:3-dehydroquinate synthase n=1 Tax=candidate division LCP-89 bacterium B3_LCP TaxID=2012998 RepID=A0A532UW08_UNCL8|nr:MAG: 3-dehydroquinate synthase [candidate division LCP-89 bacterium B3_LCP]
MVSSTPTNCIMSENPKNIPVRKLQVAIPGKSYPVIIGSDVRSLFSNYFKQSGSGRAFWITDRNVADAWGASLGKLCGNSGEELTILPPGEDQKNLTTVENLCRILVKMGVERGDTLIACGGGVVGDIVGFTAACYMRGISFVQLPTTLLAMVDASVGGKTGVDLAEGKNLVGAFHQPRFVLIDVDFLETLDPREILSGYAEVVKTALIGDAALFQDLKSGLQERFFDGSKEALIQVIEACVKYKAEVVAEDEREGDLRRVLNFGHTIGHALEVLGDYRLLKHGEAVFWGMFAALELSKSQGLLKLSEALEIEEFLASSFAKIPPIDFNPNDIRDLITHDKKVRNGNPNFILLKGIGQPVIIDQVDEKEIRESLDSLKNKMKSLR